MAETPRRVGDETKERIADLASGWSVDGPAKAPEPAATPAPEPPKGPTRRKARTVPPPPPGSAARKELEASIVETHSSEMPRVELTDVKPTAEGSNKIVKPEPSKPAKAAAKADARRKPTSVPPPIPPPPRAKPTSVPPPVPAKPDRPFASEAGTPAVIVDDSLRLEAPPVLAAPPALPPPPAAPPALPPPPAAPPKLAVPIGEFDSGTATISDDRVHQVQHSQRTVVRDAAEALLGIESPRAGVRDDPTTIDRGDRTDTKLETDSTRATAGHSLRASAMLRRQRGVLGDVRYVFTASAGVRRARRELAELEERQTIRQTSRKRHLVTLGRTAVTADAFYHPALGDARDALQAVEDERSKHAGAVAAADAELDRVLRDRDIKSKANALELSGLDGELAALAKKLEPLDKEAAQIKRRADDLRGSLIRIDKKLADTEALLVSVKGEKMDRAGIQAELATLKADRIAVQRDEPAIAAELDALNPRIAAIEARRAEAQKKRAELVSQEAEDKRRTAELLDAIGAKRKVVDRAANEAEVERDKVLFELGERLYVDRPEILGAQLAPIDQIDLELGETDRRAMELREILANIDKPKLYRGAAMIAGAVLVVGGLAAWILYLTI